MSSRCLCCLSVLGVLYSVSVSLSPSLDVLYLALLALGLGVWLYFRIPPARNLSGCSCWKRLLLLYICTIHPFEQAAIGLQYLIISASTYVAIPKHIGHLTS